MLFDAELELSGERVGALLVVHVDLGGYPDGSLVLADGVEQVAVWRFPHDPYLPGLPSAVSPTSVRDLLDRLEGPPGAVSLRTRAYRPARRAVVEVRLDGPASGRILYLKVLSAGRARSVARRHRQLTAAGLPVPGLLGLAEEQGIVALQALAGVTLGEALSGGAPLPTPEELVAVSLAFATSGVRGSRDPRAFADPVRHVELLAALLPARAAELEHLAGEAAAVDGPLVGVHGDLHPGQLLLAEDGRVTGVLDVDGAGQGFLAHDAGMLVAHLGALADLHPADGARIDRYGQRVAAAYREVAGAEALSRATAAAWLGLATSAHRAQGPGWHGEVQHRVDRAAAALRGR